MNIFACDIDPWTAAQFVLWWRHIVKMALEAVQILYAAHAVCGGLPADAPANAYKPTHLRHPCVRWAAASRDNYLWLVDHAEALCQRYRWYLEHRHAEDVAAGRPPSRQTNVRDHACLSHIPWLRAHVPAHTETGLTAFPVVISPEELARVGVYAADGTLDTCATYIRYIEPKEAEARAARRKQAAAAKKRTNKLH